MLNQSPESVARVRSQRVIGAMAVLCERKVRRQEIQSFEDQRGPSKGPVENCGKKFCDDTPQYNRQAGDAAPKKVAHTPNDLEPPGAIIEVVIDIEKQRGTG